MIACMHVCSMYVRTYMDESMYLHIQSKAHTYKLDAETKVTKRFRNPRARSCSVLSEARVLLRVWEFLNHLITVDRGI